MLVGTMSNTKRVKHLLSLCLVISLINTAFALESDNQEPLELRANFADINQNKHLGQYSGGVEFDQGTTHLRAHKAITMTNEKNKLIKAIIYGNQAVQAHYWTIPQLNKPELHAYANIIYYYPEKHIIVLKGNASIQQDANSMRADKITYDIAKKHVITSSKSKEPNQTIIIFRPQQNPKLGSNND